MTVTLETMMQMMQKIPKAEYTAEFKEQVNRTGNLGDSLV